MEFVMQKVKQVVKRIPGVLWLYRVFWYRYSRYRLKHRSAERIFTAIYHGDRFGGTDSASGAGSDLDQTRVIIRELPRLFRELSISTILDIPCGDFYWMNSVDLGGLEYRGADIVDDLIRSNKEEYKRKNVEFQCLNIIDDRLPKVDLVLCRDCLVHFSFKDILLALDNICNSNSEYLLTTTFPLRKENHDIFTGRWRTLNLEIPPFSFPPPLRVINEEYSEHEGAYGDKSLGLWRIEDIERSPTRRCTWPRMLHIFGR